MPRLAHLVPPLFLAGAAAVLIRAGLGQVSHAAQPDAAFARARAAAAAPPAVPAAHPASQPPRAPSPYIGPDARDERCVRRMPDDPPPPNPDPAHEDLRAGATFLCRLHGDARPARVVMRLPQGEFTASIRVHAPADAPAVQELSLELDHPPYADGGEFLRGEDLNGDGWMELLVMRSGGSGGTLYAVYTYDPERRRFAMDSVFDMGANVERIPGTRCARSFGAGGYESHAAADYCWREGRWVLTRQDSQDRDPRQPRESGIFLRELRELRGGQMQLVRVDTIRVPTH
jgi:hypothetical protein